MATVITGDTHLSLTAKRTARIRWYVLGMLVTIGTLSWVDRQLLAMVLQSVKVELSLTDTQLGLIGGTAFGLFYVTVGLPVAWLADRSNRRNLISLALGVWSFMTALCGFAGGFGSLFAARVGVGIGEAGQAAPSQSMVSDYFPPQKRGFAMGVLYSFVPLGYLISYSAGGFFNDTIGWRSAFVMFGGIGIVVMLLFRLTVKEPARGVSELIYRPQPAGLAPSLLPTILKFLRTPSMRHLCLGGAAHGIGMFAVAIWLPSFFMRTHHMTSTDVGLRLALLMGIGGLVGTLGGGFVADRLARKTGDLRWYPRLSGLALCACVPFTLGVYLSPSSVAAFALFAVPAVLNHTLLGPVVAIVQSLGGVRRRAMAAAFYLFLVNLISAGLGPLLVGMLSDKLNTAFGADALRYSLLLVSTTTTVWAATHLLLSGRTLRHDVAATEEDRQIATH